jgi:hypothetical protein
MSYVQEAKGEMHPVAVRPVPMGGHSSLALSARAALSLLLLLAFLHGALYALFLPPWGLIDEAQHFHYIQYIAERQALPVGGDLYLSDEIVNSLFATHRWQTFHWTPPPAPNPQVMGLEGHSYEAYQPPLFYLAMTPFYWALPQDTLVKVYGLRLVVVLLSLVTVWALYRSAGLLLPQYPQLPFWAGLLLVAIPERAISTSRINNDALLEVLAALFFLALTHSAIVGVNRRRAFLLGLLWGLAAWVKIPGGLLGIPFLLLLWQRRHDAYLWRRALWALLAIPLGGALAWRNLSLYGDLTGFNAFEQLERLAPVDTSFNGLVHTLISLPNHFWLVWWKGSEAGGNVVVTLFYALMALVMVAAWARLALHFWRERRNPQEEHPPVDGRRGLALIYTVALLVYGAAVVSSYYQGMIPVLQGRFLLPAVLPVVLLLVWGLWLYRWHEAILLATVTMLWGVGLLSLFGNLIPYFYYWSDVVAGTATIVPMNAWQWVNMVYARTLLDKPAFVAPLLVALPIGYGAALLLTVIVTTRTINPPRSPARGEHLFIRPSRMRDS